MQNAKDTFFEVLRDRVANVNFSLAVVIRGVLRTAVTVEENELPNVSPTDCLVLRWTETEVNYAAPAPLAKMRCEIHYHTAGTGAGMDRGRALSEMDATLLKALNAAPQHARKRAFAALANGGTAVEMDSNIWWSDVTLEPVSTTEDTVARVATVDVWSYEEAGDA